MKRDKGTQTHRERGVERETLRETGERQQQKSAHRIAYKLVMNHWS